MTSFTVLAASRGGPPGYWAGGHEAHRGEIRDGIECQVLEQADVDRIGRDIAHQDGVAVGSGARGELGADVAACPAAVFHYHALSSDSPASAPASVRRCRCRRRADRRRSYGAVSPDDLGMGRRGERKRGERAGFETSKPMFGYYNTGHRANAGNSATGRSPRSSPQGLPCGIFLYCGSATLSMRNCYRVAGAESAGTMKKRGPGG